MKTITKIIALIGLLFTLSVYSTYAQDANRKWWKALPPAWKKLLLTEVFKGGVKEPNDEQLLKIIGIDSLNCSNNKEITSLKPIAQLKSLEKLICAGCTGLSNLDGIEEFVNLKELVCTDNDNLLSIAPVAQVPTLVKLDFSNTMVKDLSPVENLFNLKTLICVRTLVQLLDPLQKLEKLQVLNLESDVLVYDVMPLMGCKSLIWLNIGDTKIEEIKYLQKLPQLEHLYIHKTKVKSLLSLEKLKKLKTLDCSDTEVKLIVYIKDIRDLKLLKLNRTYVKEEEVDDFKKLHKECVVEWEIRIQ